MVVFPIGLGDARLQAPVRAQLDNLGNSVLGAHSTDESETLHTVPGDNATVMPLDELLPFGLGAVQMMKMDVQGFECKVLEGARNVLANGQRLSGVVTEVTAAMLSRQCCGVQWLLHLLHLSGWEVKCNHRWGDSRMCTSLSPWAASSSSAVADRLAALGPLMRSSTLGHINVPPLSRGQVKQVSQRRAKCRRRRAHGL